MSGSADRRLSAAEHHEKISRLALVIALSVTQVIGWATTYSAPAVLGRAIAADLNISLIEALAGSSVFLVAMGLASRLIGPLYARVGAGRLMAVGSVLTALTLAAISQVEDVTLYCGLWVVAGGCGALVLTTSAHTALVDCFGSGARSRIAAVMLVSGLAASVGYPTSAFLLEQIGWRGTFMVFAAAHFGVCLPLHFLVVRICGGSLTNRAAVATNETAGQNKRGRKSEHQIYFLLAAAVSMIGFVTWGFAVAIVELFVSIGLPFNDAVALAASIGLFQVGARALETVFARHISAIRMATVAAAVMSAAFLLPVAFEGIVAGATFVALYGLASGVMSVARSTMPLELFDAKDYGAMMSRLALPMNLAFAAAPVLFGWLLERSGAAFVLTVAAALAGAALICLVALAHACRTKPN